MRDQGGGQKNEGVALTRLECAVTVTGTKSVGRTTGDLCVSRPDLSATVQRLRTRANIRVFQEAGHKVTMAPTNRRFLKCTERIIRRCRLVRTGCVSGRRSHGGFDISVRRCAFTIGTFIRLMGRFNVSRCRFTIRRAGARRIVRSIHGFGDRVKVLCMGRFGRGILTGVFRRCNLRFRRLLGYQVCICV